MINLPAASVLLLFLSCNTPSQNKSVTGEIKNPLPGTWKLLTGTIIEKKDTVITDYSKDRKFIKIINDTHFAFLNHDLKKGKDSAAANFSAGGGSYTLKDSTYTESLEYCSDRQWEGNSFTFIIRISGDTLIQKGIEKIPDIGVDRINIETYVRELGP